MTKRIIKIKSFFKCCLDGVPMFGLDHSRLFHQEESKPFFKTTLKEWGKKMEEYAEIITLHKGTTDKCHGYSTSFYACAYKGVVTILKEIPDKIIEIEKIIGILTMAELEETIYDIYLRRHRVRIVPEDVTYAVGIIIEHGTHIMKYVPKKGIPMERYCFGDWCMSTTKYADILRRNRYSKVASILSELHIDPEIR